MTQHDFKRATQYGWFVFTFCITFFSFFLQGVIVESSATEKIVLQTDSFQYVLGTSGVNLAFVERATGRNWLKEDATAEQRVCATVQKSGKTLLPVRVSYQDNRLTIAFPQEITAVVAVTIRQDRLVFEVEKVMGEPDWFTFVQIPLALEAKPYEPFAACCLSLTPHTHVHELPALHNNLWARSYAKFKLEKAKAAIIGTAQAKILTAIQDTMKTDAVDIPFSDKGGAWAMSNPDGYGSYLMNFGTLNEETVDHVIGLCRALGFKQIDIRGVAIVDPTGKAPFHFIYGSYELNPKNFPEGWKSFKKVVRKLKAAGISVILHHYATYISRDSNLVTPVPHPDLDVISTFTLTKPIDDKATEIEVNESTADVSTKQASIHVGNRTIRIGDEIVDFTDVTRKAPYCFIGCTRGFHGTRTASHQAGSKVGFLKTLWGSMYVPRPDSQLFRDMARQAAEIVNDCDLDGVYFDAIEGMKHMWGEENYWYYGGQFIFEFMKHLKKPVGLEYAGMTHHWWHYRSRYQAWDMVARGYKRFVDIHMAAMKEGVEHQHGCWNGTIRDIQKYGNMKGTGLYLPLQMGWWQLGTPFAIHTDLQFADDIEYLCCKMLANNAGLSTTGLLTEEVLKERPEIPRQMKIVRQYEELRLGNYFDESILKQLRVPGKEYTLFKNSDGKWNFKPVSYDKHKLRIHPVESPSARWTVTNRYDEQKPELRIESLYSTKAYNDPDRIDLLDAKTVERMKPGAQASGVTSRIVKSQEKVPATVEPAMELTALNDGSSPQDASWCSLVREFAEPLVLGNRRALGVWIHGDGNGQIIDFRLATEAGLVELWSSHLVTIDFTGWQYFVLVEPDSSDLSNYYWPSSKGYYVYDHHTTSADYNKIHKFSIWCNNLPANRPTRLLIGPVAALPVRMPRLESPIVSINGENIKFPVSMANGMYLEMKSKDDCRLYDTQGKELARVQPIGTLPNLKPGVNAFAFTCDKQGLNQFRARVVVKTEGQPLHPCTRKEHNK